MDRIWAGGNIKWGWAEPLDEKGGKGEIESGDQN